jgi:6-phosphogluconolactonase
MLRKIGFVVLAMVLMLGSAVPAFANSDGQSAPNAVYLMTNAPSGNQVLAYHRKSDGSLVSAGAYSTGGLGSGVGLTVPPDPLGSQNSLLLSPDGRWLFAVNAGSSEVSAFRVNQNGLDLVDKVSSGGGYPVSLTYFKEHLFVLNAAGDGSITGFDFDGSHLLPITGSTRSLHAATPANGAQPNILEAPSQVGFSPDGRRLVVTDKGAVSGVGRILVFRLDEDGIPAPSPTVTRTASPVPFSFTFDRFGHLVVVDASAGSITSYAFASHGSLKLLGSVTNGQAAVCWIAANDQFIFTDNTGSGTISAVRPEKGGLSLLNAVAGNTGKGSLDLDMGISQDGRFLYTLNVGAGSIGIFRIDHDGSLMPLGSMGGLPVVGGYQGIAVY